MLLVRFLSYLVDFCRFSVAYLKDKAKCTVQSPLGCGESLLSLGKETRKGFR